MLFWSKVHVGVMQLSLWLARSSETSVLQFSYLILWGLVLTYRYVQFINAADNLQPAPAPEEKC